MQSEALVESELDGKERSAEIKPWQALVVLLLAANPSPSEAFRFGPSAPRARLSHGLSGAVGQQTLSNRMLTSVPSSRREVSRYSRQRTKVSMGLFDTLAKAFENDDTLGEAGPAGLKKKVDIQKVTWKGPEPEGLAAFLGQEKQIIIEQEAMPGTPFKKLAEEAGVEIQYSCMQGTCRVCDVTVNGVRTPACQATLQRGKDIEIEFKDVAVMQQIAKEYALEQREKKKAARAKGGGKG